MKATGCDTVLLGTTLRETVATVNEARKIGYRPDFQVAADQRFHSTLTHF